MGKKKVLVPVVDLNFAIKALRKARRTPNNRDRSRCDRALKRLITVREQGRKNGGWIRADVFDRMLRLLIRCAPLLHALIDRLT